MGEEQQRKRWVEHFGELLNRPALQNPDEILPADEDLDIERGKLTRDDIRRAIKQLKHDKAAGPGGIPCEALKADIEGTVDMLHPLFERILVVEEVPRTRLKGRISYQVAKERRRHDQNKTNSAKDFSAKIGLNINSEKNQHHDHRTILAGWWLVEKGGLLQLPTRIRFPIGGERITCRRSKLTNSLGKQRHEFSTRVWSGRAPWNRGKFVNHPE